MATNGETGELYLDLMKRALSYTLYPEPPAPIDMFLSRASAPKRFVASLVSRALRHTRYELVRDSRGGEEDRYSGAIWPVYADTMIGLPRLDNIQYAIETVVEDGVEGDLIETGVWRGGACIFMRAVLAAHGVTNRRVFVADSFEGLPKPDPRYAADRGDRHHLHSYLAVSREEVENNFRKYALLDDAVVFLEGWFKDTLPIAPIDTLSVLRLDGDMYGSTIEVLNTLYPKLSRGGFCIIDDYALDGCRKAVDDFRTQQGIGDEMHEIDRTGRFWRKD